MDYGSFLINLITNVKYIYDNIDNVIFYHDNAPIHHAKILKKLYSCINVFFGLGYSPFLNPIEEFFALIKWKIRFISKKNK